MVTTFILGIRSDPTPAEHGHPDLLVSGLRRLIRPRGRFPPPSRSVVGSRGRFSGRGASEPGAGGAGEQMAWLRGRQ